MITIGVDSNRCNATSNTIRITVQQRPGVTVFGDTLVYQGDSATITANPTQPFPGITYQWLSGETQQIIKPVTSVTFEVREDGSLVAYDGVFELTIEKEFKGSPLNVKIDKRLLSLINSEDHTVYLCPTDFGGNKFDRFVFVSKHSSIIAKDVAILMKELDVTDFDASFVEGDAGWNNF